MNKHEFLDKLEKGLAGLPEADIAERVAFYEEMIDDRMEEQFTEEEAVSGIGTVDEVVAQILEDVPLTKLVKEKMRPKRALKVWEIVGLILGAPVWLPLFVAAIAVVLVVYASAWVVIISLWAVAVATGACVLGGFLSAALFYTQGNPLAGTAMIGAGLFCIGMTIFMCYGFKYMTKGILIITKKVALWMKSKFVGKERA